MVSKSLDINTSQLAPFAPESMRLILEWSPAHLHVMLWSRETQHTVALETFSGEIVDEDSWALVVSQSALLVFTNVEACLMVATHRALPVPLEMADKNRASKELDLYFGSQLRQHLGADILNPVGIILYWQLPETFYRMVSQHFKVLHWRHIAADAIQRTTGSDQPQGEVIIYTQNAWLVLAREGRLQYAWSVPFAGDKDLAWHLLNVCRQLEIEESEVQWKVEGMVLPDAPLYKGFSQFLHEVQVADGQQTWSKEVPEKYLSHLYPIPGA
jgi:Protein of unknown function (DUF3822)